MAINGERIRQAREIRRLSQADLALKLDVGQPTVARMERGSLEPSDFLIGQIALSTGFPVAFFEKDSPQTFPAGTLLYRKHSDLKSGEKAWLRQVAELAYSIYEALSQRVRRTPVGLPKLENEDVVNAAHLTRSALGYDPETPIRNLIYRLESSGVVCLAIPGDAVEGFDAFGVWVGRRPVIVMDANKPTDRLRFTVSHEMAHLVMHHTLVGDMGEAEKEAHKFASEFLMPGEAMIRELAPPVTFSTLAEVKVQWGVSIQALLKRAFDLGIIVDHQYKYLSIKLREMGWRKDEPRSEALGIERPRALRKLVEMYYGEDYRRLADELALPRGLVQSIVEAHASKGQLPKKEPEGEKGGGLLQFQRSPPKELE